MAVHLLHSLTLTLKDGWWNVRKGAEPKDVSVVTIMVASSRIRRATPLLVTHVNA